MKSLRKLFVAGVLAILPVVSALAQTKSVSGTVVDTNGEPLVGAMVQIKGTNVGTSTDIDGHFTLDKVKPEDVLVFSSIGYGDQEKTVGNLSVIDFVVEEVYTTLDDAVVVGYGTIKRRDLTGSISSVDSKAILEKTPTNVFEALQGSAPGVHIMTNPGPGDDATIRIRGTATFGQGANPLYVVDEVPMSDISTINPNDIVSMEILKDAASAAIYGSRSANGVILITTRRGEEGKPRVDVKYTHGFGRVSHLLPATTPEAYRFYNIQRRRWQPSGGNWRLITDSLRAFVNGDGNQFEYLLRTANKDEVNLSVSAATGKINYFLSTGFLNERGVVVNTGFQRFTTRMNTSYKATDRLTIGNNFQFTFSDQKGADEAMLVSNMYQWLPYYNLFLADGSPSPSVGGKISPYSQALLDVRDTKRFRANGQVFGELRLTSHLKVRANLSGEMNLRRQNYFRPKALLNASGINYGYDQTNLDYNWINEDYITYDNAIGNHSFSVMGGTSLQYYQIQYVRLYGSNFNGNDIWTLNNATVFPVGSDKNSSTVQEHSLASFFVRGTYNWKSRYLLAANARYDGSSRFSKSKRWGFYPSASLGWRFSDEPFLNWTKPFLTDGKFRASWGVTGNEDIANYASWPVYTSDGVYDGQGGMTPSLVYNDLSWERTKQIDLGADLSLAKGRINIVFDWYNKDTDNLLYDVNVPKETGYSSMLMNVGAINNKGIEFSIQGAIIEKRDINWSANFNISHNEGTIVELADHAPFYTGGNNIVWVQEGHRLGEFYVVKHDGVFAYDESNAFDDNWNQLTPIFSNGSFDHYEKDGKPYTGNVNKKKQGSTVLLGGDVNWLDSPDDLNGVIDWTKDRVYGGCSQPAVYGGFGSNFAYKNISLYVQFNYSLGGDIYNQALYGRNGFTLGKAAPTNEFIYNAWLDQGDVAKYPKLDSNRSVNKQGCTDYWIEDGSFIRLSSARLSYSMPQTVINYFRLKEASVYVYGSNLLTWTNYSGFDPEFGGDTLAPGVDNGRYPRKREFGLGLNLTF